jgi:hypothetical protein
MIYKAVPFLELLFFGLKSGVLFLFPADHTDFADVCGEFEPLRFSCF